MHMKLMESGQSRSMRFSRRQRSSNVRYVLAVAREKEKKDEGPSITLGSVGEKVPVD